MKVAIEWVQYLMEERAKINHLELCDIEFYEKGVKLDIPEEVIKDFEFTGLNNIDFVWSEFYNEKQRFSSTKVPV